MYIGKNDRRDRRLDRSSFESSCDRDDLDTHGRESSAIVGILLYIFFVFFFFLILLARIIVNACTNSRINKRQICDIGDKYV